MTIVPTHPSGYRIGATTTTIDGEPGTVCALIVDPRTRTVTHLAVEPARRHHQARLVPTEIATAEPVGDVRILCDHDALERLDQLEELEIIAAGPYVPARVADAPSGFQHIVVWAERLPNGDEALRHGTPVRSGAGTVGHVDGLLADNDGRITAVLVASGHFWRHRTVAVPVAAVTKVDADGLTIARTWAQIQRDREPPQMRAG